jgi:WD40 repeat protein
MDGFKDAFISYGRKESKHFASRLYTALAEKGKKVWFDQVNIPKGEDFQQRIDHGIQSAHQFIFIIAPHSIISPYCLKEIELAVSLQKRIIPVLHVDPGPGHHAWEQLHPEIGRINWIYARENAGDLADLSGWEAIDPLEKAVEELLAVMDTHTEYVYQHTALLFQAMAWKKAMKPYHLLLVGQERKAAEQWLLTDFPPPAQPPCTPTLLHAEYICESKKNGENLLTQVFIAAAETDSAIKQEIRNFLLQKCITSWVDFYDIKKGENYHDAILRGIQGADQVIFVITPESVKSTYCLKELEAAFAHNKRIIPLLLRPVTSEENPDELEDLQYIDATQGWNAEGTWAMPELAAKDLLRQIASDKRYYEQHKVFLVQALKWQQQAQNPSILLRGFNLQNAQAWLRIGQKRSLNPPTTLHVAFIDASLAHGGETIQDVFISYSRNDSDFARRLNEELQIHGKATWFDQECIAESADFQKEIYRGIETSDNFLFIISPRSVASPFCEQEVHYAEGLGKRIITLRYLPVSPTEMPKALASVQWVDFQQDFHIAFSQLIRAIETDREHVQAHSRLQRQALDWEMRKQDSDLLLRGSAFGLAELWLNEALNKRKKPFPTEVQKAYIAASRHAIEADIARDKLLAIKLRRRLLLSWIALFTSLVLLILAAYYGVKATRHAETAEQRRKEALDLKEYAESQKLIAENRALEIENSRKQVLLALQEAQEAREVAEDKRREALALRNIAESKNRELIREKNNTGKQVALALTYKGEKELENENVWFGTAYFEKSDSVEFQDEAIKKLTRNLVNSWKRSMVTPSDMVDLSAMNLAPPKDFTLSYYQHFIPHTLPVNPARLPFFRYPDRVFYLNPNKKADVYVFDEPLEGDFYTYNARAEVLVETSKNRQYLNVWAVSPQKRLIDRIDLEGSNPGYGTSAEGKYLFLIDYSQLILKIYGLEGKKFVHQFKLPATPFAYDFRSDVFIGGLSNGDKITIDLAKPQVNMETEKVFTNSFTDMLGSEDGRFKAYVSEFRIMLDNQEENYRTNLNFSRNITYCAFSPDSKYFLIADSGGNLFVYELGRSARFLERLKFNASVQKIAFDKSSRLIALALSDQTLQINAFPSGRVITGSMKTNGNLLSFGFVGNNFYEINTDYFCTFRTLPSLVSREAAFQPLMVHLHRKGYFVAAVEGKGLLAIEDAADGTDVPKLVYEKDIAFPYQLGVSPDERLVYFNTLDLQTHVWDTETGNEFSLGPEKSFITSTEVSTANQFLAIGCEDGSLSVYDLYEGVMLVSHQFDGFGITELNFSPDNRHLTILFNTGHVMVITMPGIETVINESHLATNLCYANSPNSLLKPAIGGYSPGGKYFFSSGHDGIVKIWDTKNYKAFQERANSGHPAYSFIWDSDSSFYIGTYDGYISRYTIRKGLDPSFRVKIDGSVRSLNLIPDEGMLVACDDMGNFWTFDKLYGTQLGLPYSFESPPQFLSYNYVDKSCMVQVPGQGIFKIFIFSQNQYSVTRMLGIHIDDQHKISGGRQFLQAGTGQNPGGSQANTLQLYPFGRNFIPTPIDMEKVLSGVWQGTGKDLGDYNGKPEKHWVYNLSLQADQKGHIKGSFYWYEVQEDGELAFHGTETVTGTYNHETRILEMKPVEVASEVGIASTNDYRAVLSHDFTKLFRGVWGSRGSGWGVWTAEKTQDGQANLKPKK